MHGPLNVKSYLYFCGRVPLFANNIRKGCTNVRGTSAWSLLHVTFLSSVILRWLPRFLWNLCNPVIRRYFRSYFVLETAFILTSARNIQLQYLILTFVYKRSEKYVNTVYRMRHTACGLVVVVSLCCLVGISLLCCVMLFQSLSAQVFRPPFFCWPW
jgi:hypothetical protein